MNSVKKDSTKRRSAVGSVMSTRSVSSPRRSSRKLRGKRSDTANKELSLVVTKRKAHAVSFKKSMCKKKKSSKDIGSANNTADDDDEELVVNSTVDDDGEELVVNNTAHDDVEELVVKSDNGVELNKEVSQIEGKGVNTRLLDSPRRSPRKLAEKRNNASTKIESSECESTSDASDGDNDQDFVSHDNDELDDDEELALPLCLTQHHYQI